jgi:hypothetical protein
MSESLKKKAKTLVKGKISIICANCGLDRTKDENPLTTHCQRCGFNPAFPNQIVKLLKDAQKERRQLKKKLDAVRELVKNRPKIHFHKGAFGGQYVYDAQSMYEWSVQLVELLKEEDVKAC